VSRERGIPDLEASIWLDDDMYLITVVGADGGTWPWVVCEDEAEWGCACPCCCPHEQPGRLPSEYRYRLEPRNERQCGAPTTTTGRPCRRPVREPGDHCSWHREA
jgi:hypothetical protein